MWQAHATQNPPPTVIVEMLEILRDAGARASIYRIDQATGKKIFAADQPEGFGVTLTGIAFNEDDQLRGRRMILLSEAGFVPSIEQMNYIERYIQMKKPLFGRGDPNYRSAVDTLQALRKVNREAAYCIESFDRASSVDDYKRYIAKYDKLNLCNLVSQANLRINQIEIAAVEREKNELAEKLESQRLAAAQAIVNAQIEADQRKADAEAEAVLRKAEATQQKEQAFLRNQELKRISAFQNKVGPGDETNCGPIIEVKGKLLKIAVAVANYGSEHWIRREQLFPQGYGCRFFNGQYQPPAF
jgi:hypothetical protein